MSDNKRNILTAVVVIVIGLAVVGGTYAALTLGLGVTNGKYAFNTTCFDINYDITNDDGSMDIVGTLEPSNSPTEGLSGDLSLGINPDCNVYARGNIYLNIGTDNTDVSMLTKTVEAHCENAYSLETYVGTTESECISDSTSIWVTNGSALKYAVYNVDSDKLVSAGHINAYDETIRIHGSFALGEHTDYRIYIWLDGNLIDNSYASLSFSGSVSAEAVQSGESILEAPVLDDGMIPVTIAEDGVATTISSTDKSWYDYDNKKWANIVLVTDDVRSAYLNTEGVEISEEDILAYYVWIPRYKYEIWSTSASRFGQKIDINIVFESKDDEMSMGTTVGSYRTHPAFWWDDNNDGVVDDGEMLAGIWVGKFETSTNKESICYTEDSAANCVPTNVSPRILPNVKSLRYQTVNDQFITSQKFSEGGNIYGLSSTSTDAHMMKNSEWGAVAYLSYSLYGINDEVYINNSTYYTGRSGGNVGGSVNTLTSQFGVASSDKQYNSYGYYTWIGQQISSTGIIGTIEDTTLGTNASTTGNVTGIYDMAGGAQDTVMGNYNDLVESAKFSKMPDRKYYDKYTTTSLTTACNGGVCFGHALSETIGWYGDASNLWTSDGPWLLRGGTYSQNSYAGVFGFTHSYGGTYNYFSWRSVLVNIGD